MTCNVGIETSSQGSAVRMPYGMRRPTNNLTINSAETPNAVSGKKKTLSGGEDTKCLSNKIEGKPNEACEKDCEEKASQFKSI